MNALRSLLLFLLAGPVPLACAQTGGLFTSTDLDALFAKAPQEIPVPQSSCCGIRLLAVDKKSGPYEVRDDTDRVVFVRRGRATVRLSGGGPEPRRLAVGPQDLINVPRGTALHVDPGAERLELIDVRIFPNKDARPPLFGALKPMGDVLRSSDQDALFARFDTEQPVYVQPHFRVAFVIRKTPSAWESHGCCVDIYLPVHAGSAHALLGGTIENPTEQRPGEVRGTGMVRSRAAEIGAGDMVVIRRAGPHYIDPRPGKIGYIIVKIEAE